MPTIHINGAQIYYETVGAGAEVIVFIHGLMLASESYEAQVEALKDRYRVITFDLRGQGRSEKTRARLGIDSLAEDAVVLIEKLTTDRVHVVAFSMGTFIAMRVAARRPDLVRSLCLIGPSADAEEPKNMPKYRRLIRFVRVFGPRLVASRLMMILFGDTYLNAPEVAPQRRRWRQVVERLPRALHRAAAASVHRQAITEELPRIAAPTLIISGDEDRPISPARARAVHAGIAGSRLLAFESTGHAVMIERAGAFNTALTSFLRDVVASGG
jgi:pimeloyl-ACP methyl ester carboxylesterase